jgi:hypothetical protein
MNKQGRFLIQQVIDTVRGLPESKDMMGDLQGAADDIENLASEEREKFDNMSEGLQAGPTGQAIEEAAEILEGADSYFGDLISLLEENNGQLPNDDVAMEFSDLIEDLVDQIEQAL